MPIPYNPCTRTDSYKVTHHLQDPKGLTKKKNYSEARGGEWGETTFAGLQYYCKEYMTIVPTEQQVKEARAFWESHFGADYFNYEGWMDIVKLGYIPLKIEGVLEGTTVPHHNLLFKSENTIDGFGWLAQWYEPLLMKVWYPTSVATLARNIKKVLKRYFVLYTDLGPSEIETTLNFMLQGFEYRGCSSEESAMLAGLGHLFSFMGTDNPMGMIGAQEYYNCKTMPAYSVFATEHSTMTVRGRNGEDDAIMQCLDTVAKDKIVSVVGDSYDIYEFCRKIASKKFKSKIEVRGAPFVVRPDSGDATEVVPEVMRLLANGFGFRKNGMGYDVINPVVKVLQGDGVDQYSIPTLLECVVNARFSPENFACLGMGGALAQKVNRDTHNWSIKACLAVINGEECEIFKQPVHQPMKHSKKGNLDLRKVGDKFKTVQIGGSNYKWDLKDPFYDAPSELVTYFEDGKIMTDQSFDEIRERAKL